MDDHNPTSHRSRYADVEQPSATHQANLEVAAGLREIAHVIEARSDLPPVRASVWVDEYHVDRDARADLTALASALGDRASEKQIGTVVRVDGSFHGVKLYAEAGLNELRDEPVPRDYEPILPVRPDPVSSAAEDEAWRELEDRS